MDDAVLIRLLTAHRAIAHELLELAQREQQALSNNNTSILQEIGVRRKDLLPHLEESLDNLRHHRINWQNLDLVSRQHPPEVRALLTQTQDCIMRILLLDRQNEKELLRLGLGPGGATGPDSQPRAHFVANLYRRQNRA